MEGVHTWEVWKSDLAAGEWCAGWSSDFGDAGETAETATSGGIAKEGRRHFELTGK